MGIGVKFLSRPLNASRSDVITVPLFFSPPRQTVPRPLSRFDTHPQVRLGTTENQDGRH